MYTLYGMPIESDYLAHSGKKGQEWYKRHYQSYKTVPTRSGKVGVFLGKEPERRETAGSAEKPSETTEEKPKKKSLADRYKIHKRNKQRSAALKKAREAKKTKAEEAAKKAKEEETRAKEQADREAKEKAENEERMKAVMSGTPKEVSAYMGKLTPQEYQYALNRFQNEQNLAKYVEQTAPKVVSAWDKMDSIAEKVGKISNYAQTGTRLWNNVTPLINAVADLDLPTIPSADKLFQEYQAAQADKRKYEFELAKMAMNRQNPNQQQNQNKPNPNQQGNEKTMSDKVNEAIDRVKVRDEKAADTKEVDKTPNMKETKKPENTTIVKDTQKPAKTPSEKFNKGAKDVDDYTKELVKKNGEKTGTPKTVQSVPEKSKYTKFSEWKTEGSELDSGIKQYREKYKGNSYAQSVMNLAENWTVHEANNAVEYVAKDRFEDPKKEKIYRDVLEALGYERDIKREEQTYKEIKERLKKKG